MARRTNRGKKQNSKTSTNNVVTKENVANGNPGKGDQTPSDPDSPKEGAEQTNDPEWYARDPRLVVDGANFPFNVPFGSHVDLISDITGTTPSGKNFANGFVNSSVAGICSVKVKPSFGTNNSKTDPVNVCANAFYTHVRYMNSGRKNYDPADLFIYAAAFGDIYSYLMWCERMYAYAFMYSQRNWYIGKYMIEANGVDADNIITNLANFRYWINSIINKVSSFCLPGDIYYFKRRAFMFANYYLENPYGNIKDQLYQFVPEGFYCFEITGRSSAGALRYNKITDMVGHDNLLKFEDFSKIFNRMMQNITGDEDFGLMSGDVLKAYGSNIIGLPALGEDAALMPVYDPYVLSQFKNADIATKLYRADPSHSFKLSEEDDYSYIYGDLDQSLDGLLISRETSDFDHSTSAGLLAFMNKPITVENPDPNVGDVLESTRLKLGYNQELKSWECGTEIAVSTELAYIGHNFPDPLVRVPDLRGNFLYIPDLTTALDQYELLHSNFKYAPWLVDVSVDDAHMYTGMRFACNTDNLTIATNEMLRRVHEIALLSLFYVPGVAKLTN